MYYLQSRYYDAELGRFICADVFVSTGQGVLGCNMFAYCLNNPVEFRDSGGTYAIDDDGEGLCLPFEEDEEDVYGPNCTGYAYKTSEVLDPGEKANSPIEGPYTISKIKAAVEADCAEMGLSCRSLTGPSDSLYDGEYMIAFRIGTVPDIYTGKPKSTYHFIRLCEDGVWRGSVNLTGYIVEYNVEHNYGLTPDEFVWDFGDNQYYGPVEYMAIGAS